jgi:NADPH:quinone reductase-like Zn-dependent oxidoreductase
MKQVIFRRHGEPREVVEVVDVREPEARAGEVVLALEGSPINPADLLRLRGEALTSALPAVAGGEGAGRVVAHGPGVLAPKIGALVLLPPGGAWSERVVAPASGLVALPDELDPHQAAMLSINPISAALLLETVSLAPGDWVLQNAATSAVGQLVVRLAKARLLKTVNVIRRPDAARALEALGADAVVAGETAFSGRVAEATGGAPIKLALDAIAGPAAYALAECLAPGGTLVTYGLLSGAPIQLPTARIVFEGIQVRGFSRLAALRALGAERAAARYLDLAELVRRGDLHTAIEATYPLARVKDALDHVARDARGGKVLLVP